MLRIVSIATPQYYSTREQKLMSKEPEMRVKDRTKNGAVSGEGSVIRYLK